MKCKKCGKELDPNSEKDICENCANNKYIVSLTEKILSTASILFAVVIPTIMFFYSKELRALSLLLIPILIGITILVYLFLKYKNNPNNKIILIIEIAFFVTYFPLYLLVRCVDLIGY